MVKYHGIPAVIISDRDTKFESDFWKQLWKCTNTSLRMSTAYHPESDGQTERTNRTLLEMLRSTIGSDHSTWEDELTACEIAYNTSQHAGSKFTPYYLNFGSEMNTPASTMLPSSSLTNKTVEQLISTLRDNIQRALNNLKQAQVQQAKYAK